MNIIKKHTYLVILTICTLLLGLFLLFTNPNNVSISLLVVPVLLFFFIAFCLAHIILNSLKLLYSKPQKRRSVALISAGFVTLLVILQSTGGVSTADVLLLALIIGVVGLYVDKF